MELWGSQVPLCLRLPSPQGGQHHLPVGCTFPAPGDHPAFPAQNSGTCLGGTQQQSGLVAGSLLSRSWFGPAEAVPAEPSTDTQEGPVCVCVRAGPGYG